MTPEALIVPALRDEQVPWPEGAGGRLARAIVDAAAAHGVSALLASAPAIRGWPEAIGAEVRAVRRRDAAIDALRRQPLVDLLEAFARSGVEVLIVKGTQLAFTHYQQAWLRPRVDTDLLIRRGDRASAERVLRQSGYRPATHFDGELVTQQIQYRCEARGPAAEAIDLHWRLANPHVFAGALEFEELARDARAIPGLHPCARGLSDAHALLLACLHRVAHHDNSERLIWLYDIHLLTRSLTVPAGNTVVQLAADRGLRAVCTDGLERAQSRFRTPVPADLLERLRATRDTSEPAAVLLRPGRRPVDELLTDLRSLRGWRSRLRLLGEHVLPPAAYIRHAYGVRNPLLVAAAYAHRLTGGVKWFRRRPVQ